MSDPDIAPDPEKRDVLREIAEEVRGDSMQSQQVAAILYRVSDVYDEREDTTPRDVYVNMRNILRVIEQGGRDPEPEGLDEG
jgi:hypothetical protein